MQNFNAHPRAVWRKSRHLNSTLQVSMEKRLYGIRTLLKTTPGFINFHLIPSVRAAHGQWPRVRQFLPFCSLGSPNPSLRADSGMVYSSTMENVTCFLDKLHIWGETEGKCHTSSISSFQEISGLIPAWNAASLEWTTPRGGQSLTIFHLPMWTQRLSLKIFRVPEKISPATRSNSAQLILTHPICISLFQMCDIKNLLPVRNGPWGSSEQLCIPGLPMGWNIQPRSVSSQATTSGTEHSSSRIYFWPGNMRHFPNGARALSHLLLLLRTWYSIVYNVLLWKAKVGPESTINSIKL